MVTAALSCRVIISSLVRISHSFRTTASMPIKRPSLRPSARTTGVQQFSTIESRPSRYPDVNIISRRKRTRWRTRIGNNLPIIRVRGNGCTRVRRPKNNNINKYRAVSFERKQKRSPCPGRSCACTALLTLSSSWRALLTELKTFDSFKSMLKPQCSTILDSLTRGAGVHHRSKTTCTTYVLLLCWCSMKTVSSRRIILKSYT